MFVIDVVWGLLFFLLLAITIFHDIQFRKVPNFVVLALLAGHFFYICGIILGPTAVAIQPFSSDFSSAFVGLFVGLAVLLPLWHFGAMGAGDVKFIAALGFCLGFGGLFPAFLLGSVLAGLHALIVVLLKGWAPSRAIWKQTIDTRRGIPYAAYIAFGAIAGMAWDSFNSQPWLPTLLGN